MKKPEKAGFAVNEADCVPLNHAEMDVVRKLGLVDYVMEHHSGVLEKRLRTIPDGWRRYRLLKSLLDKLLVEVFCTVPQGQMRAIDMLFRRGEIIIRPKSAAPEKGMVIAPVEDILRVTEAAMRGECEYCLKTAAEVKGCKLRKAMTNVAPPDDYPLGGCGYRALAAEMYRGGDADADLKLHDQG